MVAWAKNWEGNTLSSITPQVTGIFGGLSIGSVLDTILYIMVTVLLPMFSKLADTVGRAEAIVIAIWFYIMAGVVMACAQSMDALMVINLLPSKEDENEAAAEGDTRL
jgi:MFS family permease